MAQLDSKRRSFVKTLRDWPKGTRRRGVGFIHDQIWFPVPEGTFPLPGTTEVMDDGREYQLYLDRNMFWCSWLGFGIRIHTFHMGDDDAAPHDHPWWFITIPFRSYTETVQIPTPDHWNNKFVLRSQKVRAWIPHFRSAFHRHFVHEPLKPFRTLIITGNVKHNWSFYPEGKRVLHREWTNYNREVEE